MNSEERRLERYRIIYTWKVLEGLVPNCGIEAVNDKSPEETDRLGRRCKIPNTKKYRKSQREQSFQLGGPRLFNSLPQTVRNVTRCSVEEVR